MIALCSMFNKFYYHFNPLQILKVVQIEVSKKIRYNYRFYRKSIVIVHPLLFCRISEFLCE